MNFMEDTALFDLMYTIIIKGHTTSPYERHKGEVGFAAKTSETKNGNFGGIWLYINASNNGGIEL